jgi:hypothetical protein
MKIVVKIDPEDRSFMGAYLMVSTNINIERYTVAIIYVLPNI